MEIRYLEDFIELVQCASFTDAARRVGVSQSALSKRIKAMEANLGVELVTRDGRDVRPTPAGRELLAASIDIVNRFRELRNTLRRNALRPRVRVGGMLRDPFVREMLDTLDNAGASYAIERRDQAFDLVGAPLDSGELDVLFAPVDDDTHFDNHLYAATLLKSEGVIAAVPAFDPLASRDRVAMADLGSRVFLRVCDSHASDDGWRAIEAMCLRDGFTPKARPVAPDCLSLSDNETILFPASKLGEFPRTFPGAERALTLLVEDATFDLCMIASKEPDSMAVASFVRDASAYAAGHGF